MSSMIRMHQLTGPNQKRVAWSNGANIQYKYDDCPIKSVICGKKFVSKILGTVLTFELTVTNTNQQGATYIDRDTLVTNLINQVQVDGTALGTLISAAHTKGGMLDVLDFVANGGTMKGNALPLLYLAAAEPRALVIRVYLPFGFYGSTSPFSNAPMCSFIRKGNIKIDAPTVPTAQLVALGVTLSNVTLTASTEMLWSDEINVGPGFQMTRFKSTATAGNNSDTVVLNSFGNNSTLVGVEHRAAIASLLWATSLLTGDGTGAGTAPSITDMSGLFAGIEQTNDIDPIIAMLVNEYRKEMPLAPIGPGDVATPGAGFTYVRDDVPYPLFVQPLPVASQQMMRAREWAKFVPIFPGRRKGHISKMPIADGNPSFQLTGTFTNPDHYTYLFGIYRWQQQQFDALLAQLKEDDVGSYLYGTNDLADILKNHKKQPAQEINFSKAVHLPRNLVPPAHLKE